MRFNGDVMCSSLYESGSGLLLSGRLCVKRCRKYVWKSGIVVKAPGTGTTV